MGPWIRFGIGLVALYWLGLGSIRGIEAASVPGAVVKALSPLLAIVFLISQGFELWRRGALRWAAIRLLAALPLGLVAAPLGAVALFIAYVLASWVFWFIRY